MTTSESPKDRFCDLVMKGGIASGVVYPRAIAVLAKHYRFKMAGSVGRRNTCAKSICWRLEAQSFSRSLV
jgi:hypothetical protein